MIVALLLLIVLILLFGTAAVKGWISNAAAGGCGFVVVTLAIIWLGSFLGADGILYVILAILSILMVLGILDQFLNAKPATAQEGPTRTSSAPSVQSVQSKAKPKVKPPAEPKPIDRVWGWFAQDIALRFSPEARATAHQLYEAGNAPNLDRFCREEVARLK